MLKELEKSRKSFKVFKIFYQLSQSLQADGNRAKSGVAFSVSLRNTDGRNS